MSLYREEHEYLLSDLFFSMININLLVQILILMSHFSFIIKIYSFLMIVSCKSLLITDNMI
jgi:hypothetical protein